MQKWLAAIILCLGMSSVVHAEVLSPQEWQEFEPAWMQTFGRDSVKIIDKGNTKIYILEKDSSVSANFKINESGNVTRVNVNYTGGSPVWYIKGVRQSIKTIFGQNTLTEELIKRFTQATPDRDYTIENGVCLERVNDPQLGLLFFASYSPECPKYTK